MAPVAGYPERRPRREPHVASRLVRVCSVYDALTSPRPWGDSWESVRALAHLNRETGTEFDPDAVAAIRELLLGTEVVRIAI
jgi:putative two-component system response regulator